MMKLLLSLSIIVAVAADAKSKYIESLLTMSYSQLRRLDQVAAPQEEAFEANITAYSVKFEKCQFNSSYSAELATDVINTTVLQTERHVLFRLCPDVDCFNCTYNYGEYIVDLEVYLELTVAYFNAYQEAMFQACQQTCIQAAADDNTSRKLGQNKFYNIIPNCTICLDEWNLFENMEANGFMDATKFFLECTLIYDPEDDNIAALYAGPICASSGTKIKIGVFTDENCIYSDETKEVDDYLFINGVSVNLSNLLLKRTYTDTCISCKEPVEQNENAEGDATEDADDVIEFCEQLYNVATEIIKPTTISFNVTSNQDNVTNTSNQDNVTVNSNQDNVTDVSNQDNVTVTSNQDNVTDVSNQDNVTVTSNIATTSSAIYDRWQYICFVWSVVNMMIIMMRI
jgi:Asp-tRNA(Asn)/Glu-tRNA(Gln) amidotransferase C subunit